MSRKKETALSRKWNVLTRLYEFGCRTEKDLVALSLEKVLKMENITVSDMVLILEIQKNVRNHTLYSYLGGDPTEDNTKENE